MKKKATLSGNTITQSTSITFLVFIIIAGAGIICFAIFLFGFNTFLGYLLFGTGCILLFGGLIPLSNSKSTIIVLDPESGTITIDEKISGKRCHMTVPLFYYSSIQVQRKMGGNGSSSGKGSTYELLLMSDHGSSLQIAEFDTLELTLEFGKKLQDIMVVDLFIEELNEQIILNANINKEKILNMKLPEVTVIVTEEEDNMKILSWQNRKSIISYLSVIPIFYGFFHILYFAVTPNLKKGIIVYPIFGIFILLAILCIVGLIKRFFSIYVLRISPKGIQYLSKFAQGIKKVKEIRSDNIGCIRNTINLRNSMMQIVTVKGLDIMKRIMETIKGKDEPLFDMSMVTDFMSLKNEILNLNTASLPVADKLYIEMTIMRTLD